PADTNSRDRNDAIWQVQQIAYGSWIIADGADWTAAEPDCLRGADKCRERDCRINDRIEEQIEVVVRERFATELGNRGQTLAVRSKYEEYWRIIDPRHLGDERHNGLSYRGVADDDDIALLEIALGRGRESACAKEPKQIGLDRAGKYRRCERWPAIFSSSFSPVSPGSIANSAPKRLSSAAFIVFEVAFPGMNRLQEGKHRARNPPTLLACLSLRGRETASESVNEAVNYARRTDRRS